MKFYKEINDHEIMCQLCEHYCILGQNKTGVCKVNTNDNQKLVNLCGQAPVAIQIDPIEKKPIKKFLPGSNTFSLGSYGCNFRCPWCQNHHLSMSFSKSDLNSNSFISPEEIVDSAINHRCLSISYTYNEPTVFYPYYRQIGLAAKKRGLKNIFVSNGFQSIEVAADMLTWVDACNIDLKSFNKETYKKQCFGDLSIIKRNLEIFKKGGVHLEVATLIIPKLNDSEAEIKKIGLYIFEELGMDTVWHLDAFHPAYKMQNINMCTTSEMMRIYQVAKGIGLKNVYLGNI